MPAKAGDLCRALSVRNINTETMTFSEHDLIRHMCRKSYYLFVREFWNVIVPEPFIDNWHIKYICDELQFLVEWFLKGMVPNHDKKYDSKPYDLIINVSPGSTKSLLSSVFFQPWVWTRYPGASFIGSSFQENLSIDLARKARMVIKSPKYRQLYQNVQISDDQDAKGKFASTAGGERNSVGNKGGVTGRHADFIIVDDPLDPRGARSDIEMVAANRFITETLWSRKKDKARTPTILIMQRLHAGDPTAMMLEMAARGNMRVRHLCFPAVLTDEVQPAECRKFYVNNLFDPRRLSEPVLEEAKLQGEYSWAGQFLQRPVPLGGGLFKLEYLVKNNIIDRSKLPKDNEWVRFVRYWDKAASKDAGCYSVGFLMAKDRDQRFWILDVVRGRWDTATRDKIIVETARKDGRNVIVGVEQEPGSGGKDSAIKTVRDLAGFRVIVQRPVGRKEIRADPFSSQVNAGNVYMVKDPKWNTPLLDEMMLFPNSTYKDQVDAGSGAFSLLTGGIKRVGGW